MAADKDASFDPSVCKADYPKASLMNEEQGTTSKAPIGEAFGRGRGAGEAPLPPAPPRP